LRCIGGAKLTRVHTDGGGTKVGDTKGVSAIAGDVGSDIHAHPANGGKGTGGSKLAAKSGGIGVIGGQFTPGVICNGPGMDARTVTVVGVQQQPHLADRRASQSRQVEPQVGVQIRGAVQAHGG
jgi:hypothetical protein